MATLIELPDRASLIQHCHTIVEPFTFDETALHVKPYYDEVDTRIGWEKTYIVTIDGFGPVGFTDSGDVAPDFASASNANGPA